MNAQTFYATLFATEVAAFGIATAAFFVYLQIVYVQLTFRQVTFIFKNKKLIGYLILSLITLTITAAAFLKTSFPTIHTVGLGFSRLMVWYSFAVIILCLFFLSLSLFAWFAVSNSRFLQPSSIAQLISKSASSEKIHLYLYRISPPLEPDSWIYTAGLRRKLGLPTGLELPSISDEEKLPSLNPEENKQAHRTFKDLVQAKIDIHNSYLKRAESVLDPLGPLNALIHKTILNSDLITLEELLITYKGISKRFLEYAALDENRSEWSPKSKLLENYIQYLCEQLNTFLKLCEQVHLEGGFTNILIFTKNLCLKILDSKSSNLKPILLIWREVAANSIAISRSRFKTVIACYRELGEAIFELGPVENVSSRTSGRNYFLKHEDDLSEIHRQMAWLGEKLIDKIGIEEDSLMYVDEYTTEFDELFEAMLQFGSRYGEYPRSYPRIYFVSLNVILTKLIASVSNDDAIELRNKIFNCIYEFSSFAIKAIRAGNSEGAEVAIQDLRAANEELLKLGQSQSSDQCISLIVEVAFVVAENPTTMSMVNFDTRPVLDRLIEAIVAYPNSNTIRKEVFEYYMKYHEGEDRDAMWQFVLRLGSRLNDNFGFMFDSITGQLYPDDDPRRMQ